MYSCVFWCEFIDLVVFFNRGHTVTGCVLKITLVGLRWVDGLYGGLTYWALSSLAVAVSNCFQVILRGGRGVSSFLGVRSLTQVYKA